MRDVGPVAARTLRLLLATAVPALVAGTALGDSPAGGVLRAAGVAAVVAGPFVVLVVVATRARRAAWFAVGTLALAVAGFLLAR